MTINPEHVHPREVARIKAQLGAKIGEVASGVHSDGKDCALFVRAEKARWDLHGGVLVASG